MSILQTGFPVMAHRRVCHKSRHTNMMCGVKWYYLARMLKGSALFRGKDFNITFEPGDYLFIPLDCKYCSDWSGEEIVWDSIDFTYFPESANYPIQKLTLSTEQKGLFDEICKYPNDGCRTIGLLYTLLSGLLPNMRPEELPSEDIIRRATEFMLENSSAPICEVAKHCRLSESGLYAAFRRIGKTPVTFRQSIQISNAITMLCTTDLSIEEIALRNGFNSLSYFNRIIKKHTGMTPSAHRLRSSF